MKLLVFEEIKVRWVILKANTLFSFKESMAYSLNNWGGLASTVVYMLTYLVFLSAIFGRVKSLAGYNYSEVLLFTLVGQLNFYLSWVWSVTNIDRLGESVKTGGLDLVLTKPLPALWYVTFQKVNLFMLVFEMWPATVPLLYLLVRSMNFVISVRGLLLGVITFFAGHIALHCFQFCISLFSFWTGEYKNLNGLSYQLAFFGDAVPFEAYPKVLVGLGVSVVPFLINTALTTSFILGRTTDVAWMWYSLLVMILFLVIKKMAWEKALRAYSSASS